MEEKLVQIYSYSRFRLAAGSFWEPKAIRKSEFQRLFFLLRVQIVKPFLSVP